MNIKKNCVIILITCLTLVSNAQVIGLEWAKQMGGNGEGVGRAITTDVNGNVFTTGYFSGTVDFDPGLGVQNFTCVGNGNIFVQKLDASGNFLWTKQMGGTLSGEGQSITTDINGNVYTTGFFKGTVDFDPGLGVQNINSSGYNDMFIQKLDTNGNLLWATGIGGNSSDKGLCITTDSYGNVYTTGFFKKTVDFDPGLGVENFTASGYANTDMFIQKLDTSGNFIWAKQITGSYNNYGSSITIDTDGSVYTTGYFHETTDFDPGPGVQNFTSVGSSDIFIQKLDDSGNFLWAKQIGGSGSSIGQSIATDATHHVYITGSFNGTADFDPSAGVQNLISAGSNDIFIQKLDIDGNFLWAKRMGGQNFDAGYSINLDADRNVYTTGAFRGVLNINPNSSLQTFTSAGNADIFIQKLDTDGNFVWGTQTGGNGNDFGHSSCINTDGSIYTTGYFQETVDFDPSLGVQNLTSGGGDIYIQKLGYGTVGLLENYLSDKFALYPNPTTGKFAIEFDKIQQNLTVRLFAVSGQLILDKKFQNTHLIQLDINHPDGLYLLEMVDGDGNKAVSKLLKE